MKPWKPSEPPKGESVDKLQFFSPASQAPGDRLSLPYVVLGFNSNALRIRVDAPAAGVRMRYHDAWAPGWRATVNGAPREIAKANPASKEVALDAGINVVEFRYRSPVRTASSFLVGLNALFWLLWTIGSAALRAAPGGTP